MAQIDNVFIKQLSWSDGINVPQTNMLSFYFIIVLDLDKNMFCFIFVINGIVHYNFHALVWRIQTVVEFIKPIFIDIKQWIVMQTNTYKVMTKLNFMTINGFII